MIFCVCIRTLRIAFRVMLIVPLLGKVRLVMKKNVCKRINLFEKKFKDISNEKFPKLGDKLNNNLIIT